MSFFYNLLWNKLFYGLCLWSLRWWLDFFLNYLRDKSCPAPTGFSVSH